MSNAIVFPDAESAMQACGVGSVFERVPHGWKVRFVDGGTQVFVEGATIAEALASHGAQIAHPMKEIPQGIVEVEEERRAPIDEQPIALAVAEEAGVLPEEDRRAEVVAVSAPDGNADMETPAVVESATPPDAAPTKKPRKRKTRGE